jgi:hypothetical protein
MEPGQAEPQLVWAGRFEPEGLVFAPGSVMLSGECARVRACSNCGFLGSFRACKVEF